MDVISVEAAFGGFNVSFFGGRGMPRAKGDKGNTFGFTHSDESIIESIGGF